MAFGRLVTEELWIEALNGSYRIALPRMPLIYAPPPIAGFSSRAPDDAVPEASGWSREQVLDHFKDTEFASFVAELDVDGSGLMDIGIHQTAFESLAAGQCQKLSWGALRRFYKQLQELSTVTCFALRIAVNMFTPGLPVDPKVEEPGFWGALLAAPIDRFSFVHFYETHQGKETTIRASSSPFQSLIFAN